MYIKEDKVINTVSGIEKVEIKCTLSNGETLLCEIPKTRDGYIQITADELYSFYTPSNDIYKNYEYMNYKLTMQLPLYYSSDDELLLKIRKIDNGRKNYNNNK